jgi:hypothetical protein
MKPTELSETITFQEYSAVNHLRLDNLDEFLNSYDPIAYYVSPFSVLAQLESKVKLHKEPEEIIFCTYKPDGEIMFRFVNQKTERGLRIITYHYLSHV